MTAADESLIRSQALYWQLHARQKAYRRKVDRLLADLTALDPAMSYVSFSAGKDSAVLAHAAHRVLPGIPICCVDSGVPYRWTQEERDRWLHYAAEQGWDLRIFPWDKWGNRAIREAGGERDHQQAAHRSMFADLEAWARGEGRMHVLIGLRAAESPGRRASLSTHGEVYRKRDGFVRHCPLGRWSVDDIWAYTLTNGLPWLTIYDHLGPEARNGLIGRSGAQYGRMVWLRKYYPQAYRVARDDLELTEARDMA